MKNLLIIVLVFVFGCNNECEIKDKAFRKHLIRHHHKSKVYPYYHNNPCDCLEYGDYYNKNYKRDPRDFIEQYY